MWCRIIAVGLHLLRSLGLRNNECVSLEHTVASSSWGCLISLRSILAAVPNMNIEESPLSLDADPFGSICFGGGDNLVFVGFVHLSNNLRGALMPFHCNSFVLGGVTILSS